MLPPRPLPPFEGWPIQIADQEASLFGWFVAPNIFLFQYHEPTYGLITAQRVVHYVDSAMAANREQILGAGGMVAIHDARLISKVAADGQRYLNAAWNKLKPAELSAGYVIVADKMPGIALAALNFVNIVAAFATGKTMKLLRHYAVPFATHAVAPPSAAALFPGLTGTRG